MSRRRYRRNPSTGVKLSLGALGVGAAAFVAWVFLHKPLPVRDKNGVVIKAGYLPGIAMNGPNTGKTTYLFYPVGSKPE